MWRYRRKWSSNHIGIWFTPQLVQLMPSGFHPAALQQTLYLEALWWEANWKFCLHWHLCRKSKCFATFLYLAFSRRVAGSPHDCIGSTCCFLLSLSVASQFVLVFAQNEGPVMNWPPVQDVLRMCGLISHSAGMALSCQICAQDKH